MQKNILIFRPGQLGDTLVSMPAIHSIKKRFPDHRLFLLTDHHPNCDGFVSSWDILGPTGWFSQVFFYHPFKGLWNKTLTMLDLAKKLRLLHFERIYDFSPERKYGQHYRDRIFFQWLVGIKSFHSLGTFSYPGKNFDGQLPRLEPEWRRLLKIVDATSTADNFRLPIPENQWTEAHNRLKDAGIQEGTTTLAIGPGSKMPAKRWPVERFADLGKILLESYSDLELIVLGGREDEEIGNLLCQSWGARAHNFAGKLSVFGSAAALEKCIAYVGNDTGTMHLAGMTGIPCVALFSARDYPGMWEPFGDGHIILRHETNCARCMLEICTERNNECLNSITVTEVVDAVKNILSSKTYRIS